MATLPLVPEARNKLKTYYFSYLISVCGIWKAAPQLSSYSLSSQWNIISGIITTKKTAKCGVYWVFTGMVKC